ncbi:phosphoribosylformylglycinamidine synthase subunit PurQ [Alphaproteobacteria bacterium]|nr:phosphoribosylformylglycinamidine synthase subunit PurQ [Alphaproteobacteria bacterium]
MRAAIIIFPGSNCDRDMMVALERITGRRPALIWHKETSIDPVDMMILPGGFSFGDYLRCGALAARSPAIEAVIDHASRGGAVLGVCNGFQILLETGLLPGTLVRNADLKFVCRETSLAVQKTTTSLFTDGLQDGQVLTIPVAHNEGNYFAPEDQLAMLENNGQIVLRYTEGSHPGPANPNGAAHDIAGIISENGRVMGMMPHPERAIGDGHHSADGRIFLQAALEGVAQ